MSITRLEAGTEKELRKSVICHDVELTKWKHRLERRFAKIGQRPTRRQTTAMTIRYYGERDNTGNRPYEISKNEVNNDFNNHHIDNIENAANDNYKNGIDVIEDNKAEYWLGNYKKENKSINRHYIINNKDVKDKIGNKYGHGNYKHADKTVNPHNRIDDDDVNADKGD